MSHPFPAQVPADLGPELELTLDEMVGRRLLPRLPRPVLVNVIRSPGYVPVKYLQQLECRALDVLADAYGFDTLHHERRVDLRRTNCGTVCKSELVGGRKPRLRRRR